MIIQGDALTELKKLPSDSVDCCVTSPPYYRMRDYGAEGQIGLEDSVQEYIEKLLIVFNEVKRVLKPDGTLWINIADCYAGSGKGKGKVIPQKRWVDDIVAVANVYGIKVFMKESLRKIMGDDFRQDKLPWSVNK